MNKNWKRTLWYILATIILTLAATIFMVAKWVKNVFSVNLDAIVYTMTRNLKGTSPDAVIPGVKYCLPTVLVVLVVAIAFAVWDSKRDHEQLDRKKRKKEKALVSMVCVVSMVLSIIYVQVNFDFVGYARNRGKETKLYQDYYVDPQNVEITDNGEQRNLIYIYLESMETTYMSEAEGGKQSENYMPYLTEMANDNISFSNSEQMGGWTCVNGTGWTMGSLFATTSGLPFSFPIEGNTMGSMGSFAQGVYALGDILQEKGYTQEFLCGSDVTFAGRDIYFKSHGDYNLYDLQCIRDAGYVPSDYYVWWGVEDYHLYDVAKERATELSKSGPFNLTMLTVDTHHVAGFPCGVCHNDYPDQTANVVACADRLCWSFVEWCKTQPWYENTTIVISGDHPRMDTCLVEGVSTSERPVYNCFINATIEEEAVQQKKRSFTAMDMLPTTLAAMGYHIEGEKLGLGTNLFSGEQTLAEENGIDWLEGEISKSSSYYVQKFAPEFDFAVTDQKNPLVEITLTKRGYNAQQYITHGISEGKKEGAWTTDTHVEFEIPITDNCEKVRVLMIPVSVYPAILCLMIRCEGHSQMEIWECFLYNWW